ncbi:MAG: hypothetical protein K6F20_08380 [Bacteroidaceae bacterium]|nr:hypothetical protein [Bacteroidaceae bacterium]
MDLTIAKIRLFLHIFPILRKKSAVQASFFGVMQCGNEQHREDWRPEVPPNSTQSRFRQPEAFPNLPRSHFRQPEASLQTRLPGSMTIAE